MDGKKQSRTARIYSIIGEQSDINVMGSKLNAGNNLNLKADDEINLIAAQNTDTLNSKTNPAVPVSGYL